MTGHSVIGHSSIGHSFIGSYTGQSLRRFQIQIRLLFKRFNCAAYWKTFSQSIKYETNTMTAKIKLKFYYH